MSLSISGNHDRKLSEGFCEIFPSCGSGFKSAQKDTGTPQSRNEHMCEHLNINSQLSDTAAFSSPL